MWSNPGNYLPITLHDPSAAWQGPAVFPHRESPRMLPPETDIFSETQDLQALKFNMVHLKMLVSLKGISESPGGRIFRWTMLNFSGVYENACGFLKDSRGTTLNTHFCWGNTWQISKLVFMALDIALSRELLEESMTQYSTLPDHKINKSNQINRRFTYMTNIIYVGLTRETWHHMGRKVGMTWAHTITSRGDITDDLVTLKTNLWSQNW